MQVQWLFHLSGRDDSRVIPSPLDIHKTLMLQYKTGYGIWPNLQKPKRKKTFLYSQEVLQTLRTFSLSQTQICI